MVKSPVNSAIIIVCIINKIPIDKGWFIKENEKDDKTNNINIKFCIISDQKIVYVKILILGIKEELFLFFSDI